MTSIVTGCQRWFVASTLPNKEFVAVHNLQNQGFPTFCPLQKTIRRHARKQTASLRPVFKGYVFFGLDPLVNRWRSVNGTRGVRSVICDEVGPLPIRPGVVETMIESTDENHVLRFSQALKPGARARLISGPMADYLGIVEHLDDRERVQLLFDFFGRTTRVVADRADLIAVD